MHITRLTVAFAASIACSCPSQAQFKYQAGDIIIGGGGVIQLLRDGVVTPLITNSLIAQPYELIIDSQGRLVFNNLPACNGNYNNNALFRPDPATGEIELLCCFPAIATPGTIPPGLPQSATSFFGIAGLHATRSLRIIIDDDVNGGEPQVEFAEAYNISIGVVQDGQAHPRAFRYLAEAGTWESGIGLDVGDNQAATGLHMVTKGSATYYLDPAGGVYPFGAVIHKADADIAVGFDLHTTINGEPATFQGTLFIPGRNEPFLGGAMLDNLDVPNITAECLPVVDDNVPWPLYTFTASDFGFLNGNLFAVTNSVGSGVPWMFNLAPREDFLNPVSCTYLECVEHNGPYGFFEEPAIGGNVVGDGNRILSTDWANTRLLSVTQDDWEVLADGDDGLIQPFSVATYPPATPPLTSGALIVRIDSGDDSGQGVSVNVLLTDGAGRRIGFDAAGNEVNDFGDGGQVLSFGPAGQVRLYALIAPDAGAYELQAAGTANGVYAVRGYMAETSTGGSLTSVTGQTNPGLIQTIAANVVLPLNLVLSPPITQCLPDVAPSPFGNGTVDVDDLIAVILGWGPCPNPPTPCPADINGTGTVDVDDLIAVILGWGACS